MGASVSLKRCFRTFVIQDEVDSNLGAIRESEGGSVGAIPNEISRHPCIVICRHLSAWMRYGLWVMQLAAFVVQCNLTEDTDTSPRQLLQSCTAAEPYRTGLSVGISVTGLDRLNLLGRLVYPRTLTGCLLQVSLVA